MIVTPLPPWPPPDPPQPNLSQLGIEEEFVQLSRQLPKILCGGQPSSGEAKWGEKWKSPPISTSTKY